MAGTRPYRLFDVVLTKREQVSPSLVRLTFSGDELDQAISLAADQFIKLFFPLEGHAAPKIAETFGNDEDWYATYRKCPKDQRPAMRTYTIRELRREQKELDVEFVLHGLNGPASRWATTAQIGDGLSLCAPNSAYTGEIRGFEWKPPIAPEDIILIADETALPAAVGIMEELDKKSVRPRVRALLETPLKADIRALPEWIEAMWLPREGTHAKHGDRLKKRLASLPLPPQVCNIDEMIEDRDIDLDKQILWEPGNPTKQDHFYVWLASESRTCLDMRRYLINERCVPKRVISSMGYWREGKSAS